MAAREHRQHPDHASPRTSAWARAATSTTSTGALRDMIQNHALQLLTMIAMEPPSTQRRRRDPRREAEGAALAQALHRRERRRATWCAASTAPAPSTASRCRATSRRPRCRADSRTETFVALRTEVQNWRWAGVPFYLRTGKRLAARDAQIVVNFRPTPHSIFPAPNRPNKLVIKLQPEDGLELHLLAAKGAGPGARRWRRCPSTSTSTRPSPTNRVGAYERLLLDVIAGRLNLFVRSDEQEQAWRWVEPILRRLGSATTARARGRMPPAPGARPRPARWSRATAAPGPKNTDCQPSTNRRNTTMTMTNAEDLKHRFPAASEIPPEHRLASPIHQRTYLVGGESEGVGRRVQDRAVADVHAAAADGEVQPGRDRQLPGDGRGRERCRARRRRGRLRQRPRRMADDDGGRAHRLHAGLRDAAWSPQREPIVQLIMWEIGKSLADSRKGVRPHRRIHPGHHRGAEGTRQQQLALRGRRGHDRPDPPHAARRGAVHGPVQLSAERDLRDADPGAADGQHGRVQAAAVRHAAVLIRCSRRSASAFPAGVINTIYAPGAVVVPRMLASGKVNVLALIGSSKVADHLKKQHPKSHRLRADPRPRRQERRDHPARRGHRAHGQGVPARRAVVQRPALHGAQDADRAPLDRRSRSCGASPRNSRKLKVGMPWEKGVSITPLPGLHRTAYMTEAHRGRHGEGRARRQRGRRRVLPDAVLPGRRLPGAARA